MQPSQIRAAGFGTKFEGHHGMQPWVSLPNYKAYQSKYGPNYKIGANFHGIDLHRARILYVNRLFSHTYINNPLPSPSNPPLKPSNQSLLNPSPSFANKASFSGTTAAGFGAVAGIFALFFFADVPKVRKDIMQKVPFIGSHFIKEIAPEDNPF
ncbi:hypothetical protein E4T52_13718 [Aureobasidium sp. EXF-3400]|nr:hypothetical protein E4T51_12734 [Aureobasidium sp. EXF-12344]KAI4771286.1 hypothetical protein E4T52_13718 [Aureobasidium sp. EXF-3400]